MNFNFFSSQSILFFYLLSFLSSHLWAGPSQLKIIDENDLIIVNKDASNIPFRYKKIINAFGAVEFEDSVTNEAGEIIKDYSYACTATHIGRGYVLMAGHCVNARPTLTRFKGCQFEVEDLFLGKYTSKITSIDWGYREGLAPYMQSTCEEVVAAVQNDETGVDFAIVRVSPVPADYILPDMSRKAVFGDTVTIFSHPLGGPLQWAGLCGVERVQSEMFPKTAAQHKCDTDRGSSGATIINALTLKIVGIHDGGAFEMDKDGNPLTSGMNYGTYIFDSELYTALKELGFN